MRGRGKESTFVTIELPIIGAEPICTIRLIHQLARGGPDGVGEAVIEQILDLGLSPETLKTLANRGGIPDIYIMPNKGSLGRCIR